MEWCKAKYIPLKIFFFKYFIWMIDPDASIPGTTTGHAPPQPSSTEGRT